MTKEYQKLKNVIILVKLAKEIQTKIALFVLIYMLKYKVNVFQKKVFMKMTKTKSNHVIKLVKPVKTKNQMIVQNVEKILLYKKVIVYQMKVSLLIRKIQN